MYGCRACRDPAYLDDFHRISYGPKESNVYLGSGGSGYISTGKESPVMPGPGLRRLQL